jgi:hypothetical protein
VTRLAPILAALAACGGGDDAAPIDATALACVPERLVDVSGGPIEIGQYCDDVSACADPATAGAIREIIGGFACEPDDCEAGLRCTWTEPDVIEPTEYRDLCAISLLESEPILVCRLYLEGRR